jgi:ribosome maturation factor RimP
MALKDQISEAVLPAIEAQGAYLEDVHVATPGNHRIITVIVDGDTALNLDQVTVVTKAISEVLDAASFMGDAPFTLEVTSPGVDRPLTLPRHFAKNVTRLLKVTLNDGSVIEGRLQSNTDSQILLSVTEKKEVKEVSVEIADIKRALVEIEFNRKGDL